MSRNIILHPYITEKIMMEMEKNNKLAFAVHKGSSKKEIKAALEKEFNIKIIKINTNITKEGKIAIVKLSKEYSASDVGSRIGVY
ncbi:MAG: 50S ribosomal protein L23 [Candidatus Thermoplasmatota archaeon]|jgi:ribosomal protein uL23|nr:50S ribosomal protein L23 [Candidatus Thermoplasmatota archaeon]MCL5963006.1 50S ribosomal protein L23 [Candidatus Thermoplasmatota archaeon]